MSLSTGDFGPDYFHERNHRVVLLTHMRSRLAGGPASKIHPPVVCIVATEGKRASRPEGRWWGPARTNVGP